jgi:hypothetical protein
VPVFEPGLSRLSNTRAMSKLWKARSLLPSIGEPKSSWYIQAGAPILARCSAWIRCPGHERPAVVAAKNTSDGV